MTERVTQLKPVLDALTFAEREDLRDYLAGFDEVCTPESEFGDEGRKLLGLLLELDWEEQLAIADFLRRIHSCPPGALSTSDPNFIDILNERIRKMESGEVQGIPAEDVMREMKEKYG